MNPLLDAALEYSRNGWRVFPVNGKRPYTGHGLHDATTDPEVIAEWWRQWPEASVALRTGDGVLVLDVDDGDALHELERVHGVLPATVRAVTGGGGEHFYFAISSEVRSSAGRPVPGIDIRGDGGYVVLPPSVHESGRRYYWDEPPDEAPLAPAPVWLLERLAEHRRNGAPPVGEVIPHGQRNTELASIGGTLRRRGLGQVEIEATLGVTNRERCQPPLPDDEVKRIAASVARYEPNPPTPETTEHTEHSGANPHGERAESVRSGTEHPTEHPPNTLAQKPRILDEHDKAMAEFGLVGERHISRAVMLIHVSRLLKEPARAVVKGDSSTGKSYAVECGLKTAAPEALWVRTSTSPLALFYSEESFRHKTLCFYEANKLGDDDDPLARVLRTLISEGRLVHEVTVPEKRTSTVLEKEGPVAFISTVARASLDKEVETRILSLHSDGSDEMTQAVVRDILIASADSRAEPDLSAWHELDRWLAGGPREVVVPWGPALAEFNLSGPPRLRRDISNLLSLVRAHALLHRATRELDDRQRIVATLQDYEVVVELLAVALAVATDKAVRAGTRRIVQAVAELREEGKKRVSIRAASAKAKRSTSTTHTDVHDALERCYLVNLANHDGRYDLDVGDSLPEESELLPSAEELAAKCSVGVRQGVRSPTEHLNPSPDAGLGQGVRSVRSNLEGAADEHARIREEGLEPGAWS